MADHQTSAFGPSENDQADYRRLVKYYATSVIPDDFKSIESPSVSCDFIHAKLTISGLEQYNKWLKFFGETGMGNFSAFCDVFTDELSKVLVRSCASDSGVLVDSLFPTVRCGSWACS